MFMRRIALIFEQQKTDDAGSFKVGFFVGWVERSEAHRGL
jgi:hypothetical protein